MDEDVNQEASLADYLEILDRRKWFIIVLVLCAMIAGLILSRLQPAEYESSVALRLGDGLALTFTTPESVMTFVTSDDFLDTLIRRLNLKSSRNDLRDRVRVEMVGRNIFTVVATDSDPNRVKQIASGIADLFVKECRKINEQEALIDKRIKNIDKRLRDVDSEYRETLANLSSIKQGPNPSAEKTLLIIATTSELNNLELRRDSLLGNLYILQMESKKQGTTKILAAASSPQPLKSRTALNVFLAGTLGLIVGLGLVFILECFGAMRKAA